MPVRRIIILLGVALHSFALHNLFFPPQKCSILFLAAYHTIPMPHSPKKQSCHVKKPAPKKPVAVKKPVPPTKKPPVVPPKPAPVPQKPALKKPIPQKPVEKPAEPVVFLGSLTYTASEDARRPDIIQAIEKALRTYNTYANFSGNVDVHYDPNVATAHTEGYRGRIVFGGMISYRTALHELAHYVGCGTRSEWTTNQSNGVWTGANASELIKKLDGPDAVIHCDNLHFWGPLSGGLNYDSELTPGADIRHVALVQALVDDMNI